MYRVVYAGGIAIGVGRVLPESTDGCELYEMICNTILPDQEQAKRMSAKQLAIMRGRAERYAKRICRALNALPNP